MSQVLYRKYRSQRFAEILGQSKMITVLKQALISQRFAHAYLFTGPRGTGKTSTARILAKALNCLKLDQEGEPCNKCANCLAVNNGSFLDLIEIDAASNRGIDEIRALKEKVNFLPAEGKIKVYIIDEVHMLTKEAFNALLKTLEEPPMQVVFILATTEPHKVPATIISRTQRFDLDLAENSTLKQKLQSILDQEMIKFEGEALDLIVTAGKGSFRDAETILEKVLTSSGYKSDHIVSVKDVESILGYADAELVSGLTQSLLKPDAKAAYTVLGQIEAKGINLAQLVSQVLEQVRVSMLQELRTGKDSNLAQHIKIIKEMNNVLNELNYVPIPILSLEVAVINIVGAVHVEAKETKPVKHSVTPILEAVTKIGEVQEVKQSQNDSIKVDLPGSKVARSVASNEVEKLWPEIMNLAKEHNHHLVAFLSKASVADVEGGVLSIQVPFALYKKKLEEQKAQVILQTIFAKLGLGELKLKISLNKELFVEAEQQSNSNLVEEVFLN